MRTPLIMGNWKMNGSRASIQQLLQEIQTGLVSQKKVKKFQVAVCAPSVYLSDVIAFVTQQHSELTEIGVGAQDVSTHESGAYTGEISALMLKDIGCFYSLVGHSERRQYHAETDQIVAQKALMAKKNNLIPVICVGETLQERQSGQTESVISRQLKAIFDVMTAELFKNCVIAYEPVWAIGTGLAATPDQVQAVHAFIRAEIGKSFDLGLAMSSQILYGGSLKPANAGEILALNDVDGGLIGGASLKAEEFLAICHAV